MTIKTRLVITTLLYNIFKTRSYIFYKISNITLFRIKLSPSMCLYTRAIVELHALLYFGPLNDTEE